MTRNALLLLGACTLAAACTPTIANRGNMLQEEQIDSVITGLHTRTDVLKNLGSPTTKAPFDDNTWYYLGQETEKRGILDPKVTNEQIVRVQFDDSGIVQIVEIVENERLNVPISTKETPTHGSEMTFIQQMLGNVGKFNQAGNE
jgi:outer membrane protein assembly factor BamE (lipoprotein component of BamABCDE complex)